MFVYALLTLAALAAAAIFGWWWFTTSIETPAYTVSERATGVDIEIRDYPKMVVAEVTREGERWEAVRQGFRALAGYIFAKNRGGGEIAMTRACHAGAGQDRDDRAGDAGERRRRPLDYPLHHAVGIRIG